MKEILVMGLPEKMSTELERELARITIESFFEKQMRITSEEQLDPEDEAYEKIIEAFRSGKSIRSCPILNEEKFYRYLYDISAAMARSGEAVEIKNNL
jgi:hypothetical protein